MEAHDGGRALRPGDPVVFVDPKNRSYFAILEEGGRTDIRGHQFPHDHLIGRPEGFLHKSTRGVLFQVLRPSLAEYVTKMPRTQTIIYPKDIGTILVFGDIYPGARVLEAGIGTGAMAIALLQAVGEGGSLISYEVRQDAINRARKNIATWLGETPNHTIRVGDIYEGIEETGLDRIVLDVPEPWQVIPHAARALRDGGLITCYSPTVIQVKDTVDALHHARVFGAIETWESIHRPWHVSRESVRPELQIIGHTGFLTFARKLRRWSEADAGQEAGRIDAEQAGADPEGAEAEVESATAQPQETAPDTDPREPGSEA